MIEASDFVRQLQERGFTFFTGVPCSYLGSLIDAINDNPNVRYLPATGEGEALALAAGAYLAGTRAAVLCQNSGLGNMVNPLASLSWPFKIPILLVVSWRGQPGVPDEPQHKLMGEITIPLLSMLEVSSGRLGGNRADVTAVLDDAVSTMNNRLLPHALVIDSATFSEQKALESPRSPAPQKRGRPKRALDIRGQDPTSTSRAAALEKILSNISENAAVIATTGKTGRELFTLGDSKQKLYQVGSMGCAGPMGLGVALNTTRKVVVLDGDGATLMRLGGTATAGYVHPPNFIHIVLDNGAYDSTGGQPTGARVDFANLAISVGYESAWICNEPTGLERALQNALSARGPSMIHMMITSGSMPNLGRPTLTPAQVASRFASFLQN